jgi:signal transduction histidine kinase
MKRVPLRTRDYRHSFLLASDLASFRRQESTFIVINLVLLGLLLLLQTLLASYWGEPSTALVVTLAAGFLLKAGELIWLQRVTRPLSWVAKFLLTWASATLNTVLVLVLTILNGHENSPYFVLMMIPILEMAFRSRLIVTLGMVAIGSFLNFFFVWYYFRINPPLDAGEYLEAGTSSLIFLIVGVVVWVLVNQLRENEDRLGENVRELRQTRERLLQEERLAAVGRLSSAIAHEIRNPVAMISSSLATATRGELQESEREEMFTIAAKESDRLVTLTNDFLAYARPRPPVLASHPISETLHYVASVCRAHGQQKGVEFNVTVSCDLEVEVEIDAGQIQQALLNLVMNALDASPKDGLVWLRARPEANSMQMEIENSGAAIPERDLSRIFEPFFSTKPNGSGLGLAIARNIARAHGGDLVISANEPGRVCFAMTLPLAPSPTIEVKKERWAVS